MKYVFTILCLFIFSCDKEVNAPEINCDVDYSKIIDYIDIFGNECYYNSDIEFLNDFISSSLSTLNSDLDMNDNTTIEWFELGSQVWENGRLVEFYDWYSREIPFTWNNWNSDITYTDSELSGPIPESIINLTNLEVFWLRNKSTSEYSLSGNLNAIKDLPSLKHLGIMNHSFSGEISNDIYELYNLVTLYLGKMNLSGSISPNISNLSNLKWFWLGHNNFSGDLPEELWGMNHLYEITVEYNNFTGSIPEFSSNQLPDLFWLNLNDNNFDSIIPNSICSLTTLMARLGQQLGEQNGFVYYFDISNNKFCPEYPSCIVDYVGEQDIEECDNITNFNSISNAVYKNINVQNLKSPEKLKKIRFN